MEVYIQDVVSTVRAMSGDSLLSPQTLTRIVQAVLRAIREQDEHRDRIQAEQRITSGVRAELEGED